MPLSRSVFVFMPGIGACRRRRGEDAAGTGSVQPGRLCRTLGRPALPLSSAGSVTDPGGSLWSPAAGSGAHLSAGGAAGHHGTRVRHPIHPAGQTAATRRPPRPTQRHRPPGAAAGWMGVRGERGEREREREERGGGEMLGTVMQGVVARELYNHMIIYVNM